MWTEVVDCAQLFHHHRLGDLAVLDVAGEPWFLSGQISNVLKLYSVANVFSIADYYDVVVIDRHDGEECDLSHTEVWDNVLEYLETEEEPDDFYINTHGVLDLLYFSRLSADERCEFKRWLFHTIIPQLCTE